MCLHAERSLGFILYRVSVKFTWKIFNFWHKRRLQLLTSLFFTHPLASKMLLKVSDCISHRPLHSFSDIWGVQKLSAIFRRSAIITSSERHSSEGSVAKLCTELCHLCSNASANTFTCREFKPPGYQFGHKEHSEWHWTFHLVQERGRFAYMSGYEVPVL